MRQSRVRKFRPAIVLGGAMPFSVMAVLALAMMQLLPWLQNSVFALLVFVAASISTGFLVSAWVPHWRAGHAAMAATLYAFLAPLALATSGKIRPHSIIQIMIICLFVVNMLAMLGVWLERRVDAASRLAHPPTRWKYVASSGLQYDAVSPRTDPTLASLWNIFSIVLLCTFWIPSALTYRMHAWMQEVELIDWRLGLQARRVYSDIAVASIMATISWFILARMAFRLKQIYSASTAQEILNRDKRLPIIYLRSFSQDGSRVHESAVRDYLAAAETLTAVSSEQRLVKILNAFGPVVAIGRPGEELPELGASRLYVSNSDWQAVAYDLISRAQMVIIAAGETPGLRWEMEVVRSLLRPSQVLLFVPFKLTGFQRTREARWGSFLSWAQPLFPCGLPKRIGKSCFIYFRAIPAWQSSAFDPSNPPSAHALAAMLKRLSKDPVFGRPRAFTLSIR